MPARFICRLSEQNNGIQKIHLTAYDQQPNDAYFNVTPNVLKRMGGDVMEGDEVGVTLTLLRRPGHNGKNR